MTYNTFAVQHSKEGFSLHLYKASRFRETVADVLDTLVNKPFGHRFTWQFDFCQKLYNWAWRGEKDIATLPLDKETALKLSEPDTWNWVE
jgi:hypothetical protein